MAEPEHMSAVRRHAELLYEVAEVVNMSGLPFEVAVGTLKLVNPALSPEQATAIVTEADSRGRQLLTKNDFVGAVLLSLQNTEPEDAIHILKDLTLRMRVTFRKRFLMYDAPANSPPPILCDNPRAMATFREIFDTVANGASSISRGVFRTLVYTLLSDNRTDAANICKAALGDTERDAIGFNEFVVVLQPATSKRCLSDMLAVARRSNKGQQGVHTPTTALREEVNKYKMEDEIAQRKFAETVGRQLAPVRIPELPQVSRPEFQGKSAAEDRLERAVSELKLENEKLKHELVMQKMEATSSSGRRAAGSQSPSRRSEITALEEHIVKLEKELKVAQAQLAIAHEGSQISAALRVSQDPHTTIRSFYPDESVLLSKLEFLQKACEATFSEDGSAAATLLAQYELVVLAYQSLYRGMRAKYESCRKPAFDAAAAAASIVPKSPPPVSPAAKFRSSPVRPVTPVRWKDLDRPPTPDDKGSGTLADPLLTDKERNQLRAKLAAQMRSGARFYSPSRQRAESPHGRPALVTTSHDAMTRLQALSDKASRERKL